MGVRPASGIYAFWKEVMVRAACKELAAFRALPVWEQVSGGKVLCIGEQLSHMGCVSLAKLLYTMLTNRAVGE